MMTYDVETRVYEVRNDDPDKSVIAIAAKTIRDGGLVAFPTETVYGLGANALDGAAIQRIYEAKQRPANDPIIAHICNLDDLTTLATDIPPAAYELAETLWPGPLTMVLTRSQNVPDNIASGLPTIAIRMPVHPVAQALIKAAGVPIAAPSANTFTRPSSTRALHVLQDLQGHVDVVLDGGRAQIGLESTVVDMTKIPPVVLRPGGVSLDDLRKIVPNIEQRTEAVAEDAPSSSPGMMIKHYSPNARVLLYDGDRELVLVAMVKHASELTHSHKRVGILSTDEEAQRFVDTGARIISLGSRTDLESVGRLLFGAMRALDAQRVDSILIRAPERVGLGIAIFDRLLRAAEGNVIRIDAPPE